MMNGCIVHIVVAEHYDVEIESGPNWLSVYLILAIIAPIPHLAYPSLRTLTTRTRQKTDRLRVTPQYTTDSTADSRFWFCQPKPKLTSALRYNPFWHS